MNLSIAEQEDCDKLIGMATETIRDAMIQNADQGEEQRWRRLLGYEHVYYANEHAVDAFALYYGAEKEAKEHIEHCLVRCAMALQLFNESGE